VTLDQLVKVRILLRQLLKSGTSQGIVACADLVALRDRYAA
jgi:hypothetical protein